MTSIRLQKFMGMAPKLSKRLLPDTAAEEAQNARLLSGELRGIRTPSRIKRFTSGVNTTVYRLTKDDGTEVWLGLSEPDADVVKGPLINDVYNRHYWSGQEAYIAYNSDARIENGDPAYKLGTPTPTSAASLVVTGGSGTQETRAYTFTFVNSWGEESAPAPVVVETGFVNGSWDLSGLPAAMPDDTDRLAATNKRIYRTVTGQSSVAYFYVDETTLAATTYSDTTTNEATVLNPIALSFGWDVPPTTLEGLIAHPGGFLCAFDGRDLYFSDRYRPHTWPPEFILSVEHEIVGLAIFNSMLAVLTQGNPYFFQGNRPENMTPIKSPTPEPCLSKRSIAATLGGVMYASPNGLVLFNQGGPQVVTHSIISVEEWAQYLPGAMRGARYGEQYLGYYTPDKGIKFSPDEPFGVFVEIDKFDAVDNVLTDHKTGNLWLVRNNDVYEWEPSTGAPLYYSWLSKVFDFTRPCNFGAYVIKAEGQTIEQTAENAAILEEYNDQMFAADPPAALNPINFTPFAGARSFTVDVGTSPDGVQDIPQNRYPIGGSPLHDLAFYSSAGTRIQFTVYADGEEVFTREASPNVVYPMPSGFKAHTWQFKIVGNSDIYSLAVAETRKELENV